MINLNDDVKPSGTLFIIEAPGKREALLTTLRKMSIHGDVFSTHGHLLNNPESLWPSYIDAGFKELKRRPIKPDLCIELKALARKHERVIIATDPDDEGHVIAYDVALLLKNHKNVQRGLFYGFDRESIKNGMEGLTRINKYLAAPGTARRIIDRWIGSTFSDPDKGISVGRILTGALSLIKRKPVDLGYVTLNLPAKDGGAPFLARMPVNHTNEHLISKRLKEIEHRPALEVSGREVATSDTPMDLVDTVVRISRETGESIKVVEERLQRLYEKQHISYLRTDARSYNHKTVDLVQTLASKNRTEIKADLLPINSEKHAHESIHLLNPAIDLSSSMHFADDQQTLLTIGKNMIESAQPQVNIKADASALPKWASELEWKRTVSMNNGWYKDAEPQHGTFVRLTNEQAVITYLRDSGLGRPGTLVNHTIRLLEKGLLADNLKLTQKGLRFLKHAPEALFDLKNHTRLEHAGIINFEDDRYLDDDGMPLDPLEVETIEQRVKQALKDTGLLDDAENKRALKRKTLNPSNYETAQGRVSQEKQPSVLARAAMLDDKKGSGSDLK